MSCEVGAATVALGPLDPTSQRLVLGLAVVPLDNSAPVRVSPVDDLDCRISRGRPRRRRDGDGLPG